MTEKESSIVIRRLKAENRRLRRENEYLRHRAEQLGDRAAAHGEEGEVMRDMTRNLSVSRSRSYFDYLLMSIKVSRTFRAYDKTAFAVRNVFFASKLWRMILNIVAVLGISAQFLITVGVLAVLIPAVLIFSAAVAAVGFFVHRSWNHRFGELLCGRPVYILFAPNKKRGSGYFRKMAREYTEKGTVLIVSRSIRACGFSGARGAGHNLYLLHTSYYFSLAKRLAVMNTGRIIKIT